MMTQILVQLLNKKISLKQNLVNRSFSLDFHCIALTSFDIHVAAAFCSKALSGMRLSQHEKGLEWTICCKSYFGSSSGVSAVWIWSMRQESARSKTSPSQSRDLISNDVTKPWSRQNCATSSLLLNIVPLPIHSKLVELKVTRTHGICEFVNSVIAFLHFVASINEDDCAGVQKIRAPWLDVKLNPL